MKLEIIIKSFKLSLAFLQCCYLNFFGIKSFTNCFFSMSSSVIFNFCNFFYCVLPFQLLFFFPVLRTSVILLFYENEMLFVNYFSVIWNLTKLPSGKTSDTVFAFSLFLYVFLINFFINYLSLAFIIALQERILG